MWSPFKIDRDGSGGVIAKSSLENLSSLPCSLGADRESSSVPDSEEADELPRTAYQNRLFSKRQVFLPSPQEGAIWKQDTF